ncbi:uncharacterized protein LOC107869260 isoform X9 [Capsicum annuum]|uniref:uncharacterized protein LOC107869260 isoform X9 n=1 Tax=Capsicum annuum TaxID=4072 RepID=UPI001FB158F7|nr:uncharacterized protein LOC107869260 isoform X9 [Capsicum annuum]
MAAVAYGGEASGEHIVAGVNAMVVETLFPGYMNERSIVSTRLFLPTRKVMEKAQKLRSTLTNEMLSGTTSTNILAMTFRQVTLQHLWNFELVLFIPVAERNMDDLETPREVLDTDRLSSVIPFLSAERANYRPREGRWMVIWLTSNAYSKLEQTAGPELIAWLSEYVPAYKLQIDAEKLGNVKFEGWKETTTNTWEVFLTHSQMVGLTDILDICYEDVYTLPYKELSSGVVAKSFKRSISMSKAISMVLASGVFLVAIRILGQRYLPHFPINKYPVNSSDMISIQHQSMESSEENQGILSLAWRCSGGFWKLCMDWGASDVPEA